MKCRKLPTLKTSQVFASYEKFEIIFFCDCYIQPKTYQSFEYALSTKYYIRCRFAQICSYNCRKSNLKFHTVSSQIGEKHPDLYFDG